MCAQSHALGTHTKFQLEILTTNVISVIVYFCEIILESLQNISETTPRPHLDAPQLQPVAPGWGDYSSKILLFFLTKLEKDA